MKIDSTTVIKIILIWTGYSIARISTISLITDFTTTLQLKNTYKSNMWHELLMLLFNVFLPICLIIASIVIIYNSIKNNKI